MSGETPEGPFPGPPHEGLRAAVRDVARRLEATGQIEAARELDAAVEAWWRRQRDWTMGLARQLGVHHDINNALVGVRGNAELLLMGPVSQAPGVRARLEVVLRESDRIREAARRLSALKTSLTAAIHEGESTSSSRAA